LEGNSRDVFFFSTLRFDLSSTPDLVQKLHRQKNFQVTPELLLETGAGKRVRAISKDASNASVAVVAAAKAVVAQWKSAVAGGGGRTSGEADANGDNGNGDAAPSTSAPAPGVDKKRPKEEEEEEEGVKAEAGSKKLKTEEGETNNEAVKEEVKKEDDDVEKKQPPPPTGDPARDKARTLLATALELVPPQSRNADACPATVAAEIESAVLADHGDGNLKRLPGTRYKAKLRSLLFNLKDASNPDARRRALNGDLSAERLVRAGPEELASDARKAENEAIRAAALFEAERGQRKHLATTDQFRCGKCRQSKCTYYQMQTRSADEPMTTFVQCVNCGNRWKFC